MDLVRFGEDYHDHFDPRAYVSFYKAEGGKLEDYNEFALKGFHEFWSKILAKKNLRVLEFGGGPSIFDLIPAAPYAEEIIFAEYSEKNREEVVKWLQKSPESHDWLPYFKFVVQTLEGKNSDEEVAIRESELRKKIKHILPCDIGWEDPVKWPSSWSSQSAMFDVVTTSLCLEACVTSDEGYRHAIAKMKKYLKPGGYLVMYGVLGETYYMVGQERFYCFPLSKDLIEQTLTNEGFKIRDDMKLFVPEITDPYCDQQAMFFLSAVLQAD